MKARPIERVPRTPSPSFRRFHLPNTMNFPQALRDAIPALERCWGRCLVLTSITGRALHSSLYGRRVRIKFQVEESGKLTGNFDVWMDMEPAAARELARTLNQLADEAEKAPPTAAVI